MEKLQHLPVLVVDDEPLTRLIASETLEEAGFEVIEATNADEALLVLKQRQNVGVLFTDVNMPGSIDGLQLAKFVHHTWPEIKLLVTSGRSLEDSVPDNGWFITKPYSPTKVTQLITELSSEAAV